MRASYDVRHSPEIERIRALPVREVADPRSLVEPMTRILAKDGGSMTLLPLQALALYELALTGGVLGAIRVGEGKTLISALAPTVLESKRPLLLVPGSLVEKTYGDLEDLSLHWKILPTIHVYSYDKLSRVGSADYLEQYQPDLLVCDECHALRNGKAAVTRRVRRFMKERNPRAVMLSGSITTSSVRDFAHLSGWALKEGSPLPRDLESIIEWSRALDRGVGPKSRLDAGALATLYGPEERKLARRDPLTAVRQAVRKRIVRTPGTVVTVQAPSEGTPITIRLIKPDIAVDVEPLLMGMRESYQTPGGVDFAEAKELRKFARQLAVGFYWRYEPQPPGPWMLARREWLRFVRQCIGQGLADSPLHVAMGVRNGTIPDPAGYYEAWDEIRDTFAPKSVAKWVHTRALEYASSWLAEHGHGSLVWSTDRPFSKRLADVTGLPYYGAKGRTMDGRRIDRSNGHPAIASVQANSTGRNLQMYSRALVVNCPANGKAIEQLIGRMHRTGQERPVHIDVVVTIPEQQDSWDLAYQDAQYIETITGAPQKVLSAHVVRE